MLSDKDQETYKYYEYLLSSAEPNSLLQTIARIQELRAVAEKEAAGCDYDPHNYTADRCRVFQEKASDLEASMERRVGWR